MRRVGVGHGLRILPAAGRRYGLEPTPITWMMFGALGVVPSNRGRRPSALRICLGSREAREPGTGELRAANDASRRVTLDDNFVSQHVLRRQSHPSGGAAGFNAFFLREISAVDALPRRENLAPPSP